MALMKSKTMPLTSCVKCNAFSLCVCICLLYVCAGGTSWTSWWPYITSATSSSPMLCGISSDTSTHQRREGSIWKPSLPSSATDFVPVTPVLSESWASVLVSTHTHTHILNTYCILANVFIVDVLLDLLVLMKHLDNRTIDLENSIWQQVVLH